MLRLRGDGVVLRNDARARERCQIGRVLAVTSVEDHGPAFEYQRDERDDPDEPTRDDDEDLASLVASPAGALHPVPSIRSVRRHPLHLHELLVVTCASPLRVGVPMNRLIIGVTSVNGACTVTVM